MPVHRGDDWLLGLDFCHQRCETSVEGTDRKQNIEHLKEYFKDFAPAVQKLISYIKETHVWRLMEVTPPSWVSRGGKVVIIGDAAHATLPWVGQGGGMTLEDAATLAECLQRAEISKGIPQALKAFQEIREPRCKLV